jgi:hypothetical protein
MPDTPVSDANPNALEEWKQARSVFTTFDGYIQDLRKLGFAVLAALFTVDALQKLSTSSPLTLGNISNATLANITSISSYIVNNNGTVNISAVSSTISTSTPAPVDEGVRLGLIIVTIAYIVVLRFLEHNYQQYMNASSVRAKILERILNIELTETISERYHRQKLDILNFVLYCSFIGIALMIGNIILHDSLFTAYIVGGIGFLILAVIQFLPQMSVKLYHDKLHYTDEFPPLYTTVFLAHLKAGPWMYATMIYHWIWDAYPWEDWIIDKVACKRGEKVTISVTNLYEDKSIFFGPCFDDPFTIWKYGEHGIEKVDKVLITPQFPAIHSWKNPQPDTFVSIEIHAKDYFSWTWDTTNCDAGTLYRIQPRGWRDPIRRSILIYDPPAEKKEKPSVSFIVVHEGDAFRLF